MSRKVACLAAAAFICILPLRAQSVFTVTSLADDGPGTLRAQLLASEQTPAPTVNFSVSGVINLASTLALRSARRNGLTIDGGGQITISGGGNVRVFDAPGLITMTFKNLTIANGKADYGGGIRNNGFLTLKNVTLKNNSASNGGAIWALDGDLIVDSCTFDGNSADPATGDGGAILHTVAARMWVVNSTFTNNRAARGGAVMKDGEEGEFYNTTIAGNTASIGGGLFVGRFSYSSADADLKNTILANNTGGNCASAAATPVLRDHGGNLSYPDNTCPGLVADPQLGPLANNGGPTQTMALLSGSAAIDHAVDCVAFSSTPVTTDQRGFPRPQGPACDSGAYEKSPIEFTGFFAPIANPPQINTENAGRAIPIVFSAGGFLGMNIFAPGYPASRPVSCATGLPTGPLVPIDTPGKSGLAFDPFRNQYSMNWKTDKEWDGACRQLVVRLTDGIDRTALFRFR